MGSNRLKLNADKTQVIWVGTRQQLDKIHITELQLQSAIVQFADTVSDLGVVVDSQLNMSAHVTAVSRSCLFQLRQLRTVRHSLSMDAAKTLVSAFISQRNEWSDNEALVRSERCCTIRHDVLEIRPYHARPP